MWQILDIIAPNPPKIKSPVIYLAIGIAVVAAVVLVVINKKKK